MKARTGQVDGAGSGSRSLGWGAVFIAVGLCAALAVLTAVNTRLWEVGTARFAAAPAVADTSDPGMAAVRRMSTRLASARSFTVDAVREMDAGLLEGRTAPDSAGIHVQVKRPDKLHAVLKSPGEERHFYFDGRAVTVYDATKKLYATEPVRGNIDDMLRYLDEHFGFMPPLAEFVANNPWAFLGVRAGSARLAGTQRFNGAECRQVNITGELADAQLWVATATGLPCGLTATFTRMEGRPKLRAGFSNWKPGAAVPDARFVFRPPPDARRIPMMRLPASGMRPARRPDEKERTPMRTEWTGLRRMLCAFGGLAALHLASTAAGDSLAGTWGAPVAAVMGVTEASAQTWGVARRTARRTTRRVERRDDYRYYGGAAAAGAAYRAGYNAGSYDQCYTDNGRRYCAQMVAGEVVYVVST